MAPGVHKTKTIPLQIDQKTDQISKQSKHVKMKKLTLILAGCFMIMSSAFSQETETIFKDKVPWVSGIWGGVTHSFASYNDDWLLERGGQIGLEFSDILTVGYGWSKFKELGTLPTNDTNFRMKYNGLYVGIAPLAHKAVHPKIAILTGGGKVFPEEGDIDKVFVFKPSAGVEFNVFDFMRVGIEGGYRFVSDSDLGAFKDSDLSAPFGQVNLLFGIAH